MTQKGNKSVTEYFTKIHALGDEMLAVRNSLDDEEIVSYILAGLDIKYNSVVSAVVTRVEPISVNELYGKLLSFESHQVLLQGSSAGSGVPSTNAATCSHGSFTRCCGGNRGHTGGRNNNMSKPSNNYN
jgi:hypothetical protein